MTKTAFYIATIEQFNCRLYASEKQSYANDRRAIAGPTVWNSLPGELRDPACGFDSFKQFLKTILF